MLGLGRNIKGVEDKPEQKAKRFKFKFFWDRDTRAFKRELKVIEKPKPPRRR
tara:strand:- start:2250 stop:2405 length:156 start_codon:yes stop_codon:yes gene_type:complete